jgi:hypothetical protein
MNKQQLSEISRRDLQHERSAACCISPRDAKRCAASKEKFLVNHGGIWQKKKVKWLKANGGDLGTQRRWRAQIPAKRSGELATSFDPEIPE